MKAKKKIIGWGLFVVLLSLALPLAGDTPAEAYIDLSSLEVNAYPAAVCYLASVGQLVNYMDGQSTVEELMAMSGFCTEYAWTSTGRNTYTLEAHRYIYNTKLKLFAGQSVDMYNLAGLVYNVGHLRTGGANTSVWSNARSVIKFRNEAEAVDHLKEVIAAGTPVQVHLDFQYVAQEAGEYYPFWLTCNESSSHFVVIHGYDDNYVYYTDNNPATAIDVDVPADGLKDGVGVPLSWDAFLDAWYYGGSINQTDKNLRCGPYYMFYLVEEPARASMLQVLRQLYYRGTGGPAALRLAAEAIALEPLNGSVMLSQYLRDRKGEMVPLMADYLRDAGYDDLADIYDQIADLWAAIRENPDFSLVPQTLNAIADLTDLAWDETAFLIEDQPAISLLATDTGPVDLHDATEGFRWVSPLDWTARSYVELALKGDFSDKRSVIRLAVPPRQCQLNLTAANWGKVLAKDDGDRQLTWRVVNGENVSAESLLTWLPLKINITNPADGYELPAGQGLEVNWDAPVLTGSLRLIFCQNENFNNKKLMTAISLSNRKSSMTISATKIARIKRYADAEGWVYCYITDTKTVKTTVLSSDIIRIKLN